MTMTSAHPLAERSEHECKGCGRRRFRVFVARDGAVLLVCYSCSKPQEPRPPPK